MPKGRRRYVFAAAAALAVCAAWQVRRSAPVPATGAEMMRPFDVVV